MDLTTSLRPADRVVALVNVGLAALWMWAGRDAGYAPVVASAHIAAATLPWLFLHAGGRSGLMAWLRELYPLIVVVVVWSEMGLIRDVTHTHGHDAFVASLDRALFGQHIHATWMPAMPYRWLSEGMFFVYLIYYPAVFVTPIVLLARRRFAAVRDVVFGLAIAYLTCYAAYTLFPVDGPSYTMSRYAGPLTDGFFYQLARGAVHAGDSMGTAFPSSHVVGAVTIALLAWRWFSRPVAVLFAIEAIGVVLSTVYTQNHFAVDAIAGLFLAIATHAFLAPAVRSLWTPRLREVVPPLPIHATAPGTLTTGGDA